MIGPTGEFPDGKVNSDDQGEIRVALGVDPDKKVIVMDMGSPTQWVAWDMESAVRFQEGVAEKIDELAEVLEKDNE